MAVKLFSKQHANSTFPWFSGGKQWRTRLGCRSCFFKPGWRTPFSETPSQFYQKKKCSMWTLFTSWQYSEWPRIWHYLLPWQTHESQSGESGISTTDPRGGNSKVNQNDEVWDRFSRKTLTEMCETEADLHVSLMSLNVGKKWTNRCADMPMFCADQKKDLEFSHLHSERRWRWEGHGVSKTWSQLFEALARPCDPLRDSSVLSVVPSWISLVWLWDGITARHCMSCHIYIYVFLSLFLKSSCSSYLGGKCWFCGIWQEGNYYC